MNRTRFATFALVLLAASACGKGKAKAKDNAGSSAAGSGSGSAIAAPIDAAPAPPPPPPLPAFVMPDDVTADKTLSVADVAKIVQQWPDKGEYTFVGFPALFMGDHETLRTSIDLAAQSELKSDKALVQCDLAASEAGKKVDNKTAITVKGKLAGVFAGSTKMWFTDCVVVASPGSALVDALPTPGGKDAVAIDRMVGAYMGWTGKEVTVTGAYFGSTISRGAADKVIDVRIDLLREIGNYDGKVGCHLPLVEPDAALNARLEKNRSALTVRGTLKEGLARGAQLDPCTVVSP